MVDLDESVHRALAAPVAEPPALSELQHRAARHRRQRSAWRAAAAGTVAAVTILGIIAVSQRGDGNLVTTNSRPAAAPHGWRTYRDDAHGLAISYPPSWHPASSTLTPVLVDPIVPIALATYRLEPQRLGECDIVPQRALEALGPRDGFVAVYLYQGQATHGPDPGRPAHFGPKLPWSTGQLQCTRNVHGQIRSYPFADHGQDLSVLIATGAKFTSQRQQELYRILDTLKVQPRPR